MAVSVKNSGGESLNPKVMMSDKGGTFTLECEGATTLNAVCKNTYDVNRVLVSYDGGNTFTLIKAQQYAWSLLDYDITGATHVQMIVEARGDTWTYSGGPGMAVGVDCVPVCNWR